MKKLYLSTIVFLLFISQALVSQAQPGSNGSSGYISFNANGLCSGRVLDLSANTYDSTGFEKWHWFFGDGKDTLVVGLAIYNNVQHKYAFGGSFTVKVLLSRPGHLDSLVSGMPVVVDKICRAADIQLPGGVCKGMKADFNASAFGNTSYDMWKWIFGDGKDTLIDMASSFSQVQHVYAQGGNYDVKLVLTKGIQTDTVFAGKSLFVDKVCVLADIQLPNGGLCKGQPANFQAYSRSGNTYDSWHWFFGDNKDTIITSGNVMDTTAGGSSYSSLSHVYTSGGSYNVYVVLTKGIAKDTVRANGQVFVDSICKLVDIQLPKYMCAGRSENFNAYSNNRTNYDSWHWFFGDGKDTLIHSDSANYGGYSYVNHAYAQGGDYKIKLALTIGAKTDTVFINQMLHVDKICQQNGGGNYINWYGNFCVGQKGGSLQANTQQAYNELHWFFGDNTDIIVKDSLMFKPVDHIYKTAGHYNPYVVATSAMGNDTIRINGGDIFVNDNCGQQNMGDQNNGINTRGSFCLGRPGVFEIHAQKEYKSWHWFFGDGSDKLLTDAIPKLTNTVEHIYKARGNYHPYLVANDGVNSDTIRFNNGDVYVQDRCFPVDVYLPMGACKGSRMNMNAASFKPTYSWHWFFGDGKDTIIKVDTSRLDLYHSNVEHAYRFAGEYPVKVIANHGASSDTVKQLLSIEAECHLATIFNDKMDACKGFPERFRVENNWGISNSPITYIKVLFGDGKDTLIKRDTLLQNGGDNSFWHSYADTGLYKIMAVVMNAKAEKDTIRGKQAIRVTNNCRLLDFVPASNTICASDTLRFKADGKEGIGDNIKSIVWDFGNGMFSDSTMEQYAYTKYTTPGNYTVKLTVTTTSFGVITAQHIIKVVDCKVKCFVKAQVDSVVCKGQEMEITTIVSSPDVKYRWNNGKTTSSIFETPMENTFYVVTAVYPNGCYAKDTVRVKVTPNIFVAGDRSLCPGDTIASLRARGGNSYIWSNGDETEEISLVVHETSSFYVTGYDTRGCSNRVDFTVTVNPLPVVNAGADQTICLGQNTVLTASGGQNYKWNTGAKGAMIAVRPEMTSSYTLSVIDNNGCVGKDVVTVNVGSTPTVSITKVNSACNKALGTATGSVSGGTSPYTYVWSNNATTVEITGLPAKAFVLKVTDANGCEARAITNIGNSDGPIISGIAKVKTTCGSLCDGSATVTASGGTAPYTYKWNTFPVQTNAQATGLCKKQYEVIVKDNSGCISTAGTEIESDGNDPSVSGVVRLGNDSLPVTKGWVVLLRFGVTKALERVVSAPISSTGAYSLPYFKGGNYLMAAIADSTLYPYAVRTYFDARQKWTQADTVLAPCESSNEININMINLPPLTGHAEVGGALKDVSGGKTFAAGDPIPGVDVSLEQVPGGIVAQTQTDEQGKYKFTKVGDGNFKIFVDMPGLDMASTHDVAVTPADTVFKEANFWVDSTGTIDTVIQTIAPSSIREKVKSANAGVKIYPNPYSGSTNIEYTLEERSTVSLEVYNILGERISRIESNVQNAGKLKYHFSAQELGYSPGIYIVKLIINETIQTQRIIETN